MKIVNDFVFQFATFFTTKHYRSRFRCRWENIHRFHYQFQPIKFVNLVVPSPCETEPYIILILTNRPSELVKLNFRS